MQSIYKEDITDMLRFIEMRTELAIDRTSHITDYNQFLRSPEGMDIFDATCMRLQTIGETTKNIDNMTKGVLFALYPEIAWKSIIGLRNILSHEYLTIEPQEIHTIVVKYLPPLLDAIRHIIDNVEQGEHDDLF